MSQPIRVFIDKGQLIQDVNPASIAGFYSWDCNYYLAFQLFDVEGKPSKLNYRGEAYISQNQGKKYLIIGNPQYQANLDEFLLAPEALRESDAALDEFIEGLRAGHAGKRKTRGGVWAEGYVEGKKHKGQP